MNCYNNIMYYSHRLPDGGARPGGAPDLPPARELISYYHYNTYNNNNYYYNHIKHKS